MLSPRSALVALGCLLVAADPAFAVCSVYLEVPAGAADYDVENDEQLSDVSPRNAMFSLLDPVLGDALPSCRFGLDSGIPRPSVLPRMAWTRQRGRPMCMHLEFPRE